MRYRTAFAVLLAVAAWAADKKPITTKGTNRDVEITATAYITAADIKTALGAELGKDIVTVEVEVRPKSGKQITLAADDFILRSYKDGQKSSPYAASQIAGKGGLTLTSVPAGGGGLMSQGNGPVWGGVGGGMPQRLPGSGQGIGNSTANPESTEAVQKDSNKEKEDPLLVLLKKKSLPEGDTKEIVKGFLYFPLEGKHKAKDLALVYGSGGARVIMEFQQ
ncbi:MAG: hypothetical protein JNK48_09415 [Bryobacterales bacterium]|nr:hypothetical protein [Bryobacterales bacterium]